MIKTILKYVGLLSFLIVVFSCSTKKNTRFRRGYHELTTRYNVYFNGDMAFNEGVDKLEESLKDDYSLVLPLFTYHDHKNTKSASGKMDRVTEKTIKAIKKHSIKKKPKRKSGRYKDKDYQEWYNREEFNKKIPSTYVLMGKASFYKTEFLEAVGIFNYVVRHFPQYEAYYNAQMWMARAYAEMGWLYEAENVLSKIAEDETFPTWLLGEYSAVKADVLMKQNRYESAVPFLKTAIEKEKKKKYRRRYIFALGQMYQELGYKDEAYAQFGKVIRMNAPYEMSFNARLRLTQVFSGDDSEDIRKILSKMLKDEKNEEYHDQIYYSLAKLELNLGNRGEAIALLQQSIEVSKGNEFQRATSKILLGDLYYEQGDYRLAQPLYSDAASALSDDHPDKDRLQGLSTVLNQLAGYFETIERNDSILKISEMPEADKEAYIDDLIAQAKAEEKRLKEAAENGTGERNMNIAGESDWYFYNDRLVEQGKRDFNRQWGKRKLEDYWRLSNRQASFASVQAEEGEDAEEVVPENQTREFYLKNLLSTNDAKLKAEQQIADSYIGVADIYKIKLQGYSEAEPYYLNLIQRFPENKNVLDAKFGLYQLYVITEQYAKADLIKAEIVREFPTSRYAIILSNPNYLEELKATKALQDSLYYKVYENFKLGNFDVANTVASKSLETYPDSHLKPNFMFMQALSQSRASGNDSLVSQLKLIKKIYPSHEVSEHATAIIKMLDGGFEPALGGTGGTLLTDSTLFVFGDSAKVEETDKPLFELNEDARHYYIVIFKEESIDKNQLLFEMGRFNFNKFLIKDFDLSFNVLSRKASVFIVNGFDGIEEALWYQEILRGEGILKRLLKENAYRGYVISDANFRSLIMQRDTRKYETFYDKSYLPKEGGIENPFVTPEIEE